MSTIYEQFIEYQKTHISTDVQEVFIQHQLCLLFYKSYGIKLPYEEDVFTYAGSSVGEELKIYFIFKYGQVTVATEKDHLIVVFFHNEDVKSPFNANRCFINVDENLNFIEAEYSMYFTFLNKILNKNDLYGNCYNQMRIQRIIDLTSSYNHLSFHHSNDKDDELFIDMDKNKIDERFLKPNPYFEDDFLKVIDFVTYKPLEFHEIFDGYPSFTSCVNSSDSIIDFVNVFVDQYFNDNEKLKQNILVLNMNGI